MLNQQTSLAQWVDEKAPLQQMYHFEQWISELILKSGKKIVLLIDKVDQSSNNQLFLDFLGVLRSKYLAQQLEEDVILS